MGTFPASLELRNPCLPCVPWEPLAVGVGGEWSRGRGIKQTPGQTPSSGRHLESQKWRASRPLEENTGTRETAGRDRDRERDMRDMRAGRGEKLKGRGERGKRPSENGDPTQTAHAVTCSPSPAPATTALPQDCPQTLLSGVTMGPVTSVTCPWPCATEEP